MFPRVAMLHLAQWLGLALPLTCLLEVLRGILLKGEGAAELMPEFWAMCGFAVVIVAMSARRFHKTLE
jgi:ABC-2 type transport system permease protein